jgi:hypothetical protein
MTRARLALGLSPDDLVQSFAMIPTGIAFITLGGK